MQATYQGERTLRLRMFDHFDEHGAQMPTRDLVERFDCSATAAQRYRNLWQAQQTRRSLVRCGRCGFYDWEQNPVRDGLCLWCRADLAGLDLGHLVEDVGWERVVLGVK